MNTETWEQKQLIEAQEYLDRAQKCRLKIVDQLDLLECEIISCQSTIDLIIETLNDRGNYEA